jgi:hypothetical protein
VLLGIPLGSRRHFAYGGFTLCAGPFACPSAIPAISYSLPARQNWRTGPTTPHTQRLPAVTRMRFGLFRFRSPLLTESLLFSLPVGTEMFHFPTFPPPGLCVQPGVTGHDSSRVSPFGHPRISVRLPTPRGLSQAPTSFIGSWCQGIHRAPLLTWPQRCSRPLCSSQGTGGTRSGSPRTASWRPSDGDRALPGKAALGGAALRAERRATPVPSGPNSVLGNQPTRLQCSIRECGLTSCGKVGCCQLIDVPPMS